MRSIPAHQLFFYFPTRKNLGSDLNFSTSYGPIYLTDLKSISALLLVSFIWLGEKKILLKYLLIGGVDV